jgi:hypothetical protein
MVYILLINYKFKYKINNYRNFSCVLKYFMINFFNKPINQILKLNSRKDNDSKIIFYLKQKKQLINVVSGEDVMQDEIIENYFKSFSKPEKSDNKW